MAYARTAGWWVRFFSGRQCLASKLFSDIKCGGSRKALTMARQWRDENEDRFVAVRPGRPAFHRNDRRNNTRSVGVTLGILPLRTGSARYEWRAKWSADGEHRSRSFSVNKYGYEAAYRLAVAHRCAILGIAPESKRPPPLRVVLETRSKRPARKKIMNRKPDHDPDCECCSDGMETYLKKTEDNIRRFGHSVVSTWIETPEGNIGMAYTVGLADAGLPELIVFGLPFEAAAIMLNTSAERLRQGALALDAPVEEIGNLPMVFKAVEPSVARERIIQANNRVGRELPAIQMIWPDPKGRFPWDPAFDTRFSLAQPLLFTGHAAPRRTGLH